MFNSGETVGRCASRRGQRQYVLIMELARFRNAKVVGSTPIIVPFKSIGYSFLFAYNLTVFSPAYLLVYLFSMS